MEYTFRSTCTRSNLSAAMRDPTGWNFTQNGGERGSRTLDTLRYTHFPGVLLRPLGHLTVFLAPQINAGFAENTIQCTPCEGALMYTSKLANAMLFRGPCTKKIRRILFARCMWRHRGRTHVNEADNLFTFN